MPHAARRPVPAHPLRRLAAGVLAAAALAGPLAAGCAAAPPEVRGTWLTTTANTHIATPAETARTMARLREIGLNTVYVESWKNGYTQFPSEALERVIGVERRPNLMKSDPSDPEPTPPRDLLQETVIEAHRNQLACIAWFEYGFMAAHESTQNHLRKMYPHWLSRDAEGGEVAPNGFVWMNPLHPRTRRLVMDIVLEAVDKYDLDGVQLDDRIVWPYYTMGYDDFTVDWYRNEHGGQAPPEDPNDPEWRRWRVEKVNEFSRQFVAELRAKRPGLIVSLSPAPYPWCYENYLLEWPEWASWRPGNDESPDAGAGRREGPGVWWDEFIPQCYRYDYPAFKATWEQQIGNLRGAGPVARRRVDDMLAGVLTTGSRPDPVPWPDLEKAIGLVRETGGGGHVWWFSRGVLDEYPEQIASLYDVEGSGHARRPDLPRDWRPAPVVLERSPSEPDIWRADGAVPIEHYRVIVKRGGNWAVEDLLSADDVRSMRRAVVVGVPGRIAERPGAGEAQAVELLVDRRPDLSEWPPRIRGGAR